jgi:hypothetical protein
MEIGIHKDDILSLAYKQKSSSTEEIYQKLAADN